MYRAYFGLNNLPFKTTPDISVFYKHGSRQEILEALVYTVTRGDGIVKVTGEVGCGKTMLLRLLAHSLPSNFSIVYINSPNLSAKDMILYICSELDINVDSSMLKFTLLTELKNELVRLYSLGKHVVMLIDEAQSMTIDVLEEIRLLSNLETDDDKLIQIVLFGQPELDIALQDKNIRQLKSRISFSIYIPPLTPSEVQTYLNYRVRKCAYQGLDLFDHHVSKQVHDLSLGLPRTINIIADKLLMSAYGRGDSKITTKHVRLLPEYSENSFFRNIITKRIAFIFLVVTVFLSLLVYVFYNNEIKDQWTDPVLLSIEPDEVVNVTTSPVPQEVTKKSIPIVLESSQPINLVTNVAEINDDSPFGIYHVEDENVLVDNPILLSKLLLLHSHSEAWIKETPESTYVVQLSTWRMSDLESVVQFYKRYEIPIDSLHLLIDFKSKENKFRLKVFYLTSPSYSHMVDAINQMPAKLRLSKPYITTVKQLSQNIELTSHKLKQHGIYNDGK